MPGERRRLAVSSVVGMLLFVLVFMAALGSLAYVSSLQSRSAQTAQQAQQLVNERGKEMLSYTLPSGSLSITNSGAITSKLVAVILRYSNGTVYSSGSGSWNAQTVSLPSGTTIQIQTVIPSGTCGTTTCLVKYNAIVAGASPAGSIVGELTSLGNVFWYNPSVSTNSVNWAGITEFPSGCAAGQYITAVEATLTCSAVGYAQLTGYPSPCPVNQYITAVGSTLTCSQLTFSQIGGTDQPQWTNIQNFPAACTPGQVVTGVGASLSCGSAPVVKLCSNTIATSGQTGSIRCPSSGSFSSGYKLYHVTLVGSSSYNYPQQYSAQVNDNSGANYWYGSSTSSLAGSACPSNSGATSANNYMILMTPSGGNNEPVSISMQVGPVGNSILAIWTIGAMAYRSSGFDCSGTGIFNGASSQSFASVTLLCAGTWDAGTTTTVYGLG